jgi:hypothetical protein
MTANIIIELSLYAFVIACYGVFFRRVTERGELLGWYLDALAALLSPYTPEYLSRRKNTAVEYRSDLDREEAFDNFYYKVLGGCAFCHVGWLSLIVGYVYAYKAGYPILGFVFTVAFASVTTTLYQLLRKWTS